MNIYLAIIGGMLVTIATGWIGTAIARRIGLIDVPGTAPHKKHSKPTPIAGGIALILAFAILFFLSGSHQRPQFVGTFFGALIVFAIGLIDDIRIIKPLPKFLGQVAALAILVASGNYIRIFENPSFPWSGEGILFRLLNLLLTAFWVIGITNAFNLVDSMDGLCVGLSGLTFGFFVLGSLGSSQPVLAIFSAMLLGVCVVLLFLNTKPSRLFLGDSGAMTFGFLIAALAILFNPLQKVQLSSWFLPVLLVSIPIFDTSLVFFSRLRRGMPFYKSGCDHTYHRLVALGLEPSHAVLSIILMALFVDCLAFIALELPAIPANLIFAGCLLLYSAAFFVLDQKRVVSRLV